MLQQNPRVTFWKLQMNFSLASAADGVAGRNEHQMLVESGWQPGRDKQIALTRNLGRSISFLAEGKRLL